MQHTNEKGKCVTHQKRSPEPSRRTHGRIGAPRVASSISRGAFAVAWIVGVVWLIAVGLLPATAAASQSRLFAGTFGGAASTPADPYPLEAAESVAVDDVSHDIYVSDERDARVEKFDSAGHFISMFGKAVNKAKVEAHAPEAEQNLCIAGEECQSGEKPQRTSPLEEPGHVAVDNSGGPSQGDVYVATQGEVKAGLVDKFDSTGHLVATWADAGQFDGSTAISPAPLTGPFGSIRGIAVDASGNLWVDVEGASAETSGMLEFRQDASFVTGWGGLLSDGFALDSEDNVYLVSSGIINKYDAAGHEIGVVAPSKAEGELYGEFADRFGGIVVDPSNGELYGDYEETIRRYEPSCRPVITDEVPQPGCAFAEAFGAGLLHNQSGLAVDPTTAAHPLYVAEGDEVASFSVETVPDVVTAKPASPTQSSATLTGTVNPDGVELDAGSEGCRFEWGETAGLYEHTVACEETAAQIGSGDVPVEVQAAVTGLQSGHTYHYRLVAGNANDVNQSIDEPSIGADVSLGAPLLESESSMDVSSTSATLQTTVDPNDLDTSIYIEYGAEAGVYGSVTPETAIGAGGSSQSAPIHIQGLTPSAVYHYRSVAINLFGTSSSEDHTFTTQAAGVFSLPDGRVWELASPPDKHGALLEPLIVGGVTQASADGDAISYLANAATEAQAPGNSNLSQVLSTRGEADATSWVSSDISAPRGGASGYDGGPPQEYRFFSTDLSLSVAQPYGLFDPTVLSAEASERTAFLHTDYTGGDPADLCSSSCYRPLVTGASGFANVPAGIEFGGKECNGEEECSPKFVGASPDGSHIVLKSNVAGLIEGAPAESLYEWAGGELRLVSILPNGEPAPNGSNPYLGTSGTEGVSGGLVGSSVSADGSRIVWSTTAGGRLYVSDMTREETVELGGKEARFQSASTDGSRVLYTVDGNLYAFEAPLGGELSAAQTTELIPDGEVAGEALGASQDDSTAYFVSMNALTSLRSPQGEAAQAGQPNLYAYRAGTISLVAVLAGEDQPDWEGNFRRGTPTRVSPDGRWLEFMSERSLTGYDNRDATSGERDEEVFLYDAGENGAAARLVCASCNPTGARPHGLLARDSSTQPRLLDQQNVWGSRWLAANVPEWASTQDQPRYLSDSGRLFFNSSDALVAPDTNGTEDVYEYEPPGVGSCTTAAVTFSPRSEGCVGLISSGTGKEESVFLDASENGDDVFFLTSAQLVREDTDAAVDVYDARVGGGFPEAQSPPACEGDACQSPVAPPTDPTPGSLTYHGPGNVVPAPALGKVTAKKTRKCAKGRRRTDGKCTKVKKKAKRTRKTARRGRVDNNGGAKS